MVNSIIKINKIMFKSLFVFVCVFIASQLAAQSISFSLEIDKDTLGVGELVTVTYVLKGTRGDFQEPEFKNLRLVGGPNYSSQISIVQGKMDQTFTYSYVFQPIEPGDYKIPEASVEVEDEVFYSPSSTFHVTENEAWDPNKSEPIVPKKNKSTKGKKVTEI